MQHNKIQWIRLLVWLGLGSLAFFVGCGEIQTPTSTPTAPSSLATTYRAKLQPSQRFLSIKKRKLLYLGKEYIAAKVIDTKSGKTQLRYFDLHGKAVPQQQWLKKNAQQRFRIMGKVTPQFYNKLLRFQGPKPLRAVVWVHADDLRLPPKTWIQERPETYRKQRNAYFQRLATNKQRAMAALKADGIPVQDMKAAPFFFATMSLVQMKQHSKHQKISRFYDGTWKYKNLLSNIQQSFGYTTFHSNGYKGKVPSTNTPVKVVHIEQGRPSNQYLPSLTGKVRAPNAPLQGNTNQHVPATNHTTQVAGIILSNKTNLGGLAPEVDYYMANFNCAQVGSWIAGSPPSPICNSTEVDTNMSWAKGKGQAIWNISYEMSPYQMRWVDHMVNTQYILPVAAVGNYFGPFAGCGTSNQLCRVANKLKNGITVGNLDDKDTLSHTDDHISNLSS